MSKWSTLYIFWDVETTSNEPTEDDIISIGLVVSRFGLRCFEKLGEFHSYVSTPKTIAPAAESVHHISARDLQGFSARWEDVKTDLEKKPRLAITRQGSEVTVWPAPPLPEALAQMKTFLEPFITPTTRTVWIAHNGASFDEVILFCNMVNHRLQMSDLMSELHCVGFLDSLRFLKQLMKGEPADQQPVNPSSKKISFKLGFCYQSWCGGHELEGAHDALADSQALFDIFNSSCVISRITETYLYKNEWYREVADGLRSMESRAGIRFQQQLDAMMDSIEEEQEQHASSWGKFLTSQGSVWDDSPEPAPHEITTPYLCLSCMHFYRVRDTHTECRPQALVSS